MNDCIVDGPSHRGQERCYSLPTQRTQIQLCVSVISKARRIKHQVHFTEINRVVTNVHLTQSNENIQRFENMQPNSNQNKCAPVRTFRLHPVYKYIVLYKLTSTLEFSMYRVGIYYRSRIQFTEKTQTIITNAQLTTFTTFDQIETRLDSTIQRQQILEISPTVARLTHIIIFVRLIPSINKHTRNLEKTHFLIPILNF